MLPSNTKDLEEIIKYGNEQQLRDVVINVANGLYDLEKTKREFESVEEQLYFARQLIDDIEEVLEKTTRLADFKRSFLLLLDETYFER